MIQKPTVDPIHEACVKDIGVLYLAASFLAPNATVTLTEEIIQAS